MSADKPNKEALAASRLPELPNAGYSTKAQQKLTDAMTFLIRGLERNRELLLQIVKGGKYRWRKTFTREFRWIKADDEMADAVFGYLTLLAGPNVDAEQAKLEMAKTQQQRRQWDKRTSTLIKQSKDVQALLKAIKEDEAKSHRRPVTIVLGDRGIH